MSDSLLDRALPAAVVAAPTPAPMSAHECEVFERELSFSWAVAERDSDAFIAHPAPEPSSPSACRSQPVVPRRSRMPGPASFAATACGWTGIRPHHGECAPRPADRPRTVEGLHGRKPGLALSTLQSVRRRQRDGRWHVLFDTGTVCRRSTSTRPTCSARPARRHAGRPKRRLNPVGGEALVPSLVRRAGVSWADQSNGVSP